MRVLFPIALHFQLMMNYKQILQHEQEAPAALLVERQRQARNEANSSTN